MRRRVIFGIRPPLVTTTTTYGYDSLYRLTSVNDPNGSTSYSYDPVGNRLSKVLGSATNYSYDKADRNLSAGSTSYTVNANGNVTTRGSDSFSYDQANRLTSAAIGGATWTYTYDGDGKRASQAVGTTSLSYLYDVNKSLPDVLADGTYTYVYGVGLAFAVDGSGNLRVYHTDGLGSMRAISDNNGNVIESYQTDAFGVPTSVQGTSAQPFQFTGQPVDYNGLVYLRARYYDPEVGRFLGRDPLFGVVVHPSSLNRYSYAQNRPTRYSDATGLVTGGICVAIIGGVGAYATAAICVNAAANGDVGLQVTLGGGGTAGIVGGLSVGPQVSSGNSLSDLTGPFGTAGGSVRAGPGIGVDAFWGPNSDNRTIWGGALSFGIGADYTFPFAPAAEIHAGTTATGSSGGPSTAVQLAKSQRVLQ